MSRYAASDVATVALGFPDDFPLTAPMPVFSSVPVAGPPDQTQSEPTQSPEYPSCVSGSAHGVANSMAAAVAWPAHPRRSDRRRSPRQTLVARAVIRSEPGQVPVGTGFISNISALGVGFHTRQRLAVGETFQFRVEAGPLNWATRLRVVSCQPHESGTYDIGAEFVAADLSERPVQEIAA